MFYTCIDTHRGVRGFDIGPPRQIFKKNRQSKRNEAQNGVTPWGFVQKVWPPPRNFSKNFSYIPLPGFSTVYVRMNLVLFRLIFKILGTFSFEHLRFSWSDLQEMLKDQSQAKKGNPIYSQDSDRED